VWLHLLVFIATPEEIKEKRRFAWVRVSSICDFLNEAERIALMSYLRYRHKQLGL
jgi:hypothetical protein